VAQVHGTGDVAHGSPVSRGYNMHRVAALLGGEYDREALCTEIWNLTGMQTALHFQAIDDDSKKDPKNKTTPVKVLHIEIDWVHQT